MTELTSFFVILAASVFFSAVFRRLHVPWVIALIAAGVLLGPSGFGVLEASGPVEFFGTLGLVFLMFMAGLETKLSTFKEAGSGIVILALLNGLIPLAAGFGIAYVFGFELLSAILIGIVFVSSSIAVVVPSLEARGIIETRLGKTIVAAAIIEDVASLLLLSFVLQTVDPITVLPLPLFYGLLLVALVVLRWLLPKLRFLAAYTGAHSQPIHQQELRAIFAILIGVVASFELLGLHPIIAGFFAGLVLSDSITSELLHEKLRTISYGLFIPVFFILVGLRTDIEVLFDAGNALALTGAVVGGSIAAKFTSGYVGGILNAFSARESAFIGAALTPQLSTTLAAVFAAAELGIVSEGLITAMVALSVTTTLLAPIMLELLTSRRRSAPLANI